MVIHGDLFDVLPTLDAESIDACVTDPPYGIGFMGREWDTFKPDVPRKQAERLVKGEPIVSDNPNINGRWRSPAISESQIFYDRTLRGQREFQVWTERWASEVLRVLKPGAYAVVCGAPRSHHRMMSGLEDAGFVIRDCMLFWGFGQGFPKSKNLGNGRGTALKPAYEPIALAWKPFKGSISANVERWGTGALNIDTCMLHHDEPETFTTRTGGKFAGVAFAKDDYSINMGAGETRRDCPDPLGRWPANVLLDEDAAAMLDKQTGELTSGAWDGHRNEPKTDGIYQGFPIIRDESGKRGDTGGASRFYYVAKPSREERDYGCGSLPTLSGGEATDRKEGSAGLNNPRAGAGRTGGGRNSHPTVKPVELMRWLVKLVTPVGGTVLDPFTGSGTTGMACRYEQRQFIGIERERDYVAIAERRIAAVAPLFSDEASA